MKKGNKNFCKFACLLLSVLTLNSCNLFTASLKDRIVPDLENVNGLSGEGYSTSSSYSFTLKDVYETVGMKTLNSIGDSKILVVPVQLTDSPRWSDSMVNNARLAFFGESNETGWESVSSFYYKSSYGKLNISGEVSPILNLDYSISELANSSVSQINGKEPYLTVVKEFLSNDSFDEYRKKYDVDKDGYIDSIAFIYSNKIDSDNGYWALTSWHDSKSNLDLPNINSFLWASYNFINGDQKHFGYKYASYGKLVDSHTIIHETGHLLGIDDYYCYDDDGYDPSGTLEMHSSNIGDESIYSKFSLGWVDPYYVKTSSSVTLTLRTSSKYPDAILINDNWNNSSCDEYLLIEYYSPDILNNKDAVSPYGGNGFQMLKTSGFRIYHIDARIVELSIRGAMIDYSDTIEDGKSYYVGASNSASLSYLKNHKDDFKLVHLLESGGVNTFKKYNSTATEKTLFKKGATFESSKEFFYNINKFNSNEEIGYKISIDKSNDFQGTLTISKI